MALTEEEVQNTEEETREGEETEANGAKRKRTSSSGSTDATEEQIKKSKAVSEDNNSSPPASPKIAEAAQEHANQESAVPQYGVAITSAIPPLATDGSEPVIVEVPCDKVGSVIGSKGAIIQEIQTRSGAKAHVNQDFPEGVPRQISLVGTPSQIKAAADLIRTILEQGPQAIHINAAGGAQITTILECTQDQVGKVIGTKGATIKELQHKSGCRIQIDQDYPPDQPRKINITGTATACALAAQLINTVMTQGAAAAGLNVSGGGGGNYGGGFGGNGGAGFGYGGGGYGQPQGMYGPAGGMGGGMAGGMQPQYGGGGGGGAPGEMKKTLDVPKSIVGKIIGRGGETITSIQRKSGCRVQVEQNVPEGMPCHIQMSGNAQSIQAAMSLIQETMLQSREGESVIQQMAGQWTLGPNPAPMGGAYGMAPQMGQQPYGMPAAYGMPPMQQPMQQQYGYGGYPGMGAPPMQQFGQPQQYGMPAAGGYQAYGAAAGGMPGAAPGYGAPQQFAHAAPAAAAVPKAAPAVVWTEHKTDDGITYWYNATTGVSQWERPKGL